jgi:hypothetical protein
MNLQIMHYVCSFQTANSESTPLGEITCHCSECCSGHFVKRQSKPSYLCVVCLPSFFRINFSLTQSFRPQYGPGVYSASNRNEYQEYFLRGKDGWFLGLTTLTVSCANYLEIQKPQPPGTPTACLGQVRNLSFFILLQNIFTVVRVFVQ